MSKKYFHYKVGHPSVSKMLQEIAFAHNYTWASEKVVQFTDKEYLLVSPTTRNLYYAGHNDTVPTKSVEVGNLIEFIKILEKGYKPLPTMFINSHLVTFEDSGNFVKIGCTTVIFNEVEQIYNTMKELKGK